MKIVVLGGAGAMGQVTVRDLTNCAFVDELVICDFNQERAEMLKASLAHSKLKTAFANILDKGELIKTLAQAQVVVNATPYYYNLKVMEAALAAGCHYLDLGGLFHVTRTQLTLDKEFKEKGLLAILGVGAAPGITNIMAASAAQELDLVDSIHIAIGCADFAKVEHPFYPPYALDTILDEYTKEPMVFENGQFKAQPPVSGELEIEFPPPIGRSKAILTLHSEVATLPLTYKDQGIQNVTFRLGLPIEFHEKLKFLVNLGLGDSQTLDLKEGPAIPREVLKKLLDRVPQPHVEPNDCEVVRVDVNGSKDKKKTMVRFEAIVYADKKQNLSCGALDTGVPPSIVAQMIGRGQINRTGVIAPEVCIPPGPFFSELAQRNIIVQRIPQVALV